MRNTADNETPNVIRSERKDTSFRSMKELIGYSVRANDGDFGRVDDFFFDEKNWTVRYAVVSCGFWLNRRKVLISPEVFCNVDYPVRHLQVDLTRDQIRRSPVIDTARPIARSQEIELFQYYNWPMYWTAESGAHIPAGQSGTHIPRLRGVKGVRGHVIKSTDGTIGHAEDLIVEDKVWVLRYLVVDTRQWLLGKSVLIAVSWIVDISRESSAVFVHLTREQIKNSPLKDQLSPVNRKYEEDLYDYYNRPGYWGS